jgi:hypothetical protein
MHAARTDQAEEFTVADAGGEFVEDRLDRGVGLSLCIGGWPG